MNLIYVFSDHLLDQHIYLRQWRLRSNKDEKIAGECLEQDGKEDYA